MKSKYLLLFLAGFYFINAQEKLGITNSNYSSTNSIFLNPVSSVDSRVYMQLNLIGLNAYAFTNSVYLPQFSFWQLRRSGKISQPVPSNIKLKQFAYVTASVEGPAFVISKRNYGAGFFVRARSVADVKRVPYELTSLVLSPTPNPNLPKEGNINLRNLKASNMTWIEYGGNFGYMIKKQRNDIIAIGGSLRYLTGINIFYTNLSRLQGFYNDSVVSLDKMTGKIRYNTPAWNTGKGFGLDLGVTYKKMLGNVDSYFANSTQSGCARIDYKYKLSASLRDLGYINFKKGTSHGELNASGYYRAATDTNFNTILETNFSTILVTGKPILAALPTNLSVQGDWNFENHVYLNATFVANLIPNRVVGVQAPNLISICPRVEFQQFEVAMPLTFQRFIYPQLGIAARYRTFVIGFDNLFPLIMMKNTYGLNAYFSLGISLFRNPACKSRVRSVDDCTTDNKAAKKRKGPRKKLFGGRKKSNV